VLSDLWERIRSTVVEGIGWVGDTWAIRTLGGIGRAAITPIVDLLGEPVAEFVTRLGDAVDAIVHLVLTPIRRAWAPLGLVFASLAGQVKGLASSVYDGFRDVLLVHLPKLRQWVVDNVLRPLWDLVSGLRSWAAQRVSDLWRGVTDLRRWATQHIVDLWRQVSDLRQWVVDNVLRPLWDLVTDLVAFVYGRVLAVVHLVEASWATLLLVARYGPSRLFLLLLPGGLGRLATDLMRATQGSAMEAVEALDDAADRMLRL